MITIDGQMDAGSCCTVTYTTGGATQLTLTAFAGSPNTVDGVMYRLVWLGAGAEDFYHQHGAGLTAGRRLLVKGTNPRPLIDRGDVCIMLDVLGIQVIERVSAIASKPTGAWPWPTKQGQARTIDQVKWAAHEVGA